MLHVQQDQTVKEHVRQNWGLALILPCAFQNFEGISNIFKTFELRKPWYFRVLLYKSYFPQIVAECSGLILGNDFLLCEMIQ